MAKNYSSTPVLSKIKIGDSYYYLKDADVRAIVNGINDDVYESLKVALQGNAGDALATWAFAKDYIDSAVEAIPEFDVEVVQALPEASEATWHKIYLLNASGAAEQNLYKEYITVRQGSEGAYTYSWEQIGDTAIDLSGYVTDVKYVDASHKLQQQKGNGAYADVHTFGAFADANQGEGIVNDYVTGVSSAKVTADGSISGAIAKDAAKGVQIEGTVSAPTLDITLATTSVKPVKSVGTLPSKKADAFTPGTLPELDTTKFSGGSKAADSFTAASLASGFYTAGSAASFKEGAFTPASLTTEQKTFATEGVMAEVGTGTDAECLIITNAGTGSVKGVDVFSGGSKAADTFTTNKPAQIDVSKFNGGSFVEGAFTAASMDAGIFSAGSLPTFTEGAFTAGTLPELDTAVTLATGGITNATASAPIFTGEKYAFSGEFTGSEVDATVTLAKGNKTITVAPKSE